MAADDMIRKICGDLPVNSLAFDDILTILSNLEHHINSAGRVKKPYA